jgi:organic radical activating enzyme
MAYPKPQAVLLAEKFISGLETALRKTLARGSVFSVTIPREQNANALCAIKEQDTGRALQIAVMPASRERCPADSATAFFTIRCRELPPGMEPVFAKSQKTILKYLSSYEKKAGEGGVEKLGLSLQIFHRNPGVGGTERAMQQRINITESCNQNCPFCAVGRDWQAPSTKEILRQAAALADIGCRRICISGGEPTTHPDFLKLLKKLNSSGMEELEIQTNGVNFADEKFLKNTLDAGANVIVFSFHAHTEKAYDRITGTKGQLARASLGFENLVREPATRKLKILVMIVLNKYNYRSLERHIAFLSKLAGKNGKFALSLSQLNQRGCTVAPDFMEDFGKMRPFLRKAQDCCKLNGIEIMPMSGSPCMPPLCLFTDEQSLAGERPSAYSTGNIIYAETHAAGNSRAKSPVCRECKWDAYCPGVTSQYAERFGLSALQPISVRRKR